jgi:hypothetical protein
MMNNIDPSRGLSPVSVADTTPQVSQILDMSAYWAAVFVILTGSIADADATFTVLVEHGDQANLSDAAAVPDEYLNGTEALAGFIFSDDDQVRKIGYTGIKRYVRVTITPVANASAALLAGVWIGFPHRRAAENPPV